MELSSTSSLCEGGEAVAPGKVSYSQTDSAGLIGEGYPVENEEQEGVSCEGLVRFNPSKSHRW